MLKRSKFLSISSRVGCHSKRNLISCFPSASCLRSISISFFFFFEFIILCGFRHSFSAVKWDLFTFVILGKVAFCLFFLFWHFLRHFKRRWETQISDILMGGKCLRASDNVSTWHFKIWELLPPLKETHSILLFNKSSSVYVKNIFLDGAE